MRRRWLLNLALAVFVVGLVLLNVYKPGAKKETGERQPLTTINADSITTIRLQRPNQEDVVLQKDNEQWRLVAPVNARADRFRVDNLLQLLGAKSEGTLPANDFGKYGLDKPLAIVRFNDDEIRFGALHPFNNLQYALYANQVHLLSTASFRQAAMPWDDFLSTALLEKDIKPVAFAFPRFNLTLKEGTWELKPANKDISGDRVNTFVEEWRYARALKVARHQGKAPTAKVRITYIDEAKKEAARPQMLEIGIAALKPEVVLYRADENLDYHFPVSTGERLLELKPE